MGSYDESTTVDYENLKLIRNEKIRLIIRIKLGILHLYALHIDSLLRVLKKSLSYSSARASSIKQIQKTLTDLYSARDCYLI